MDYVRLGRSGLKVSRIAMGCMSFTDANVALLRAEAGRDPINQELTDLVAQLSTGSEAFRLNPLGGWAATRG